jgi:Flp pilus assembly CpaF family ATPase
MASSELTIKVSLTQELSDYIEKKTAEVKAEYDDLVKMYEKDRETIGEIQQALRDPRLSDAIKVSVCLSIIRGDIKSVGMK